MYPVSLAFQRAIRSVNRIASRVEWSPDGGETWLEIPFESGSVTCDRTSDTRWTASLTVNKAHISVGAERDLMNPYGPMVRLFRGLSIPRIGPELVPWGVYRVDDVDEGTTYAKLNLVGKEMALIDARFLVPRRIGGASARPVVEALVSEVDPRTAFTWDANVQDSQWIPSFIEERDRWGVLEGGAQHSSIATSLGAEMYYDGRGSFTVQRVPTLGGPSDWSISSEDGESQYGIVVTPTRTMTRQGVYNVVVALGETSDGAPPVGPALAWDNDPTSLTYAGPDPLNAPELVGEYGLVPKFYTSPLLTSMDQCLRTANSLLASALGLQKGFAFTGMMNPALTAGDVVSYQGEQFIIDSWSADLDGATMSCTTRSSKQAIGDEQVSAT